MITLHLTVRPRECGGTLLEVIIVTCLLSFMIGATVLSFSASQSMIPLRLSAIKLQSLMRQTLRAAQSSGHTNTITFSLSAVRNEASNMFSLPPSVQVKNPRAIIFYPTRVASPYTVVLANQVGECRLTLSLRARVQLECFRT